MPYRFVEEEPVQQEQNQQFSPTEQPQRGKKYRFVDEEPLTAEQLGIKEPSLAEKAFHKGGRLLAQGAVGTAQNVFLPYEIASSAAALYMKNPGAATQYMRESIFEDIEDLMEMKAAGQWSPEKQEQFEFDKRVIGMDQNELAKWLEQFQIDPSIGGLANAAGLEPQDASEKALRLAGLLKSGRGGSAVELGKEFAKQGPVASIVAGLSDLGIPEALGLPLIIAIESIVKKGSNAISQAKEAGKAAETQERPFGMKNLPATAEKPLAAFEETVTDVAKAGKEIREQAAEFPKDVSRAVRGEVEKVFPKFIERTPEQIKAGAGSLFAPMRKAAEQNKTQFLVTPSTMTNAKAANGEAIGSWIDKEIKTLRKSESSLDPKGKELLSYLKGIQEDFLNNPMKSLDEILALYENLNAKINFDMVLRKDARLQNFKKTVSNAIEKNAPKYKDVYKQFKNANAEYSSAMNLIDALEVLEPVVGEKLDMAALDKILFNKDKVSLLNKTLGPKSVNNLIKINKLTKKASDIYESIDAYRRNPDGTIELAAAVGSNNFGWIIKKFGLGAARKYMAKILTDPKAQAQYNKLIESFEEISPAEQERRLKSFGKILIE